MPRRLLGPVLFGLLAVSVACGGGGGKNEATKTPSSAGTPTAARQTPQPASSTETPAASGDAAGIEAVVRAQATANNNKDVDGFVGALSDSYLTGKLNVTREQAHDLVALFIGEPLIEITRVSDIKVSGDSATARVQSNEGVIVSDEKYTFAREAGQWRIAGTEDQPVEIPASTKTVALGLLEYRYTFDAGSVTDGKFAFRVSNSGAQDHEVQLKKLPDGVSAAQLADPQSVPAGIETVGVFGPLAPGAAQSMVFSGALAPGRYAMVCYLKDPNGQLHSQLGMIAEFTVQ